MLSTRGRVYGKGDGKTSRRADEQTRWESVKGWHGRGYLHVSGIEADSMRLAAITDAYLNRQAEY